MKKWILILLLLFPMMTAEVWFIGPPEPTAHDREVEQLSSHISQTWKLDYSIARKYVDLAVKHEKSTGFPSRYDILAVTQVESGFRANAKDSKSPSVGLMQVNAKAHKMPKQTLLDPEKNIEKGAEILHEYRKKAKSDRDAFIMYNAGPGGYASICAGKKSCTTPYSAKVQKAKAEFLKRKEPSWKS